MKRLYISPIEDTSPKTDQKVVLVSSKDDIANEDKKKEKPQKSTIYPPKRGQIYLRQRLNTKKLVKVISLNSQHVFSRCETTKAGSFCQRPRS